MTTQDSAAEARRNELLAAIDSYHADVQRLDADAVASWWTDDAVLWTPDTEEIRGSAGVLKLLEGLYPQLTIEAMHVHSRRVDVRDDLAVEHTSYTERVKIAQAQPQELRGRYVFVWNRQTDGAWKIRVGILNYASGSEAH